MGRELEVSRALSDALTAVDLCEIFCAWNLSADFELDDLPHSSDPDESSTEIVKIFPLHLEFCYLLGGLYSLCPDDDAAPVSDPVSCEWPLEYLPLGAHDGP